MGLFSVFRKKTEIGNLIEKLSDSPSASSTRAAGASNADPEGQQINKQALDELIEKVKEIIKSSNYTNKDFTNDNIKTTLWHRCSKEEYAKLEQIGWNKILPEETVKTHTKIPDVDPYADIRNMKEISAADQDLIKRYNEFKSHWGTDMLFAEDKQLVKFQQAIGVFAEFKNEILHNTELNQKFARDYSLNEVGINQIEIIADTKKGAAATRKDLEEFQLNVKDNSSKPSAPKNR